ncbi:hypothetical protein B0H34DRAFT_648961 [Crassisporium funariophilum]|nr:hypothetical protein B0H34DRAFT_648961 [Crassisporium funariophilum]
MYQSPHQSTAPPPRKRKKVFNIPAVYYPPALSPSEKVWRDRYEFIKEHGYQLRPRYRPNWTPTLLGNGRHHHSGEDHIMQIMPQVLDAVRLSDGLVVCIKIMHEKQKFKQVKVLEYFSSPRMSTNSRNHAVPFIHSFGDRHDSGVHFLIMPPLRRFDDPDFVWASEVADFVSQTIEGLTFLHTQRIAHYNLTADTIMMDAKTIIPTGWHFVAHFCEPDGMTRISPLERKRWPVRYYFVGFGDCFHVPRTTKPLIQAIGGSDQDVPELFTGKPYDPFKLDIYTLANVFQKQLFMRFHGLDFLSDLISYMRTPAFEERPTAEQAMNKWYTIRDSFKEEVLEGRRLQYREGMKPRYSPEVDSEGMKRRYSSEVDSEDNTEPVKKKDKGKGKDRARPIEDGALEGGQDKRRSDKRDISSILNS